MLSLRQAGFFSCANILDRRDDSDQDCGPEVVPVDTDDELNSAVDALQHDLEDHEPSPINRERGRPWVESLKFHQSLSEVFKLKWHRMTSI